MDVLTVIGLNHRSAPVDLRERFALDAARQADLQRGLADAVTDSVLLCTCNRTELICTTPPSADQEAIRHAFVAAGQVELATADGHVYVYRENEAMRHILRVASGLDSMITGETQITGQAKAAFEAAFELGFAGRDLQQVYQRMLACAKQVRSQTGIGEGAVSVSSIAVHLARSIFEVLSDKRVMLIGAGEMCELAGEHFRSAGVRDLIIANRSPDRAAALAARLSGRAEPLDRIPELLTEVDIVLSSTDAREPIIKHEMVATAIRRRRGNPLFLIDIAVPRDIESTVNRLPDVYLYNIDDLERLVQDNLRQRAKESERAEVIIESALVEFSRAGSQEIGPLISSLRERATTIKDAELEKLFRQHPDWTEAERQKIGRSVELVVNKLLHDPIISLRKGQSDDAEAHRSLAQAFRDFFNL